MLNTPRPLDRQRKTIPGWSRPIQKLNDGWPAIFLSSGMKRQQISVVQALGFDVLVAGNCQWRPRDKGTVVLVSHPVFGSKLV